MTEPIKNALIQFRVCPTCGKRITGVSKAFADPEEVFAWLDDDDLREDYEVLSLPCPACDPPDAERYATHLTLIVDGQEIGEPSEIGTMAIPVMADDPEKAHFDVVFDEEEGKAHDAANVAFAELPQSIFDPFVERYVRDTRFFGQVDAVLKAWPDWRWIAAFRELGLPEPEDGDYRKAARNDETIDRLLRWHIRDVIRRAQESTFAIVVENEIFDPWTTEYFILHVPLPEALEPVRTEFIGRYVRNPVHDRDGFLRRIRELQSRLDAQRKKNEELRRRLDESRRAEADLRNRLGQAYARIRQLEAERTKPVETPAVTERRRCEKYKAIIEELKQNIERLEEQIEALGQTAPPPVSIPEETVPKDAEPDWEEIVRDKTILVIGGNRPPTTDRPVRILHHDGRTRVGIEPLVGEADAIVFIVPNLKHKTYWAIMADLGDVEKPVVYSMHNNGDIILQLVAKKFRERAAEG